jgi:hypothetical protein
MEIEGLIITGNVLLVMGRGIGVAWLLTEEGLVEGVFGGRRAGRSDSIWTIPLPQGPDLAYNVEGQVGAIYPVVKDQDHSWFYHTETGESLPAPQQFRGDQIGPGFQGGFRGRDYLRYHGPSRRGECGWQTSEATLKEGWVKDPEGRHRFWVPIEWRADWEIEDWCHDVTTQFIFLDQTDYRQVLARISPLSPILVRQTIPLFV